MKLILQAIKALFRKLETALSKIETKLGSMEKWCVNPNWNAAEGEPGHVLNRTHYKEWREMFAEAEIDATASVEYPVNFLPDVGTKCEVTYNGIAYNCRLGKVVDGGATSYVLGNLALMNEVGDTGEPFVIVLGEGNTALALFCVDMTGAETATVSISAEVYKKLDRGYLPDNAYVITLPADAATTGANLYQVNMDTTELVEALANNIPVYLDVSEILSATATITCEARVLVTNWFSQMPLGLLEAMDMKANAFIELYAMRVTITSPVYWKVYVNATD